MDAIAVRDLGKNFGAARALDGVSFGVADGAFVCLVGPSGCGKTTLLRIIAGLETPSEGSVMLGRTDATQLPPARRGMGVVFQSYALFPNLTASRNVAFGLHGKGWRHAKRDARTAEMLALVGLQDFARRRPAQLSGGQQQRVALARALAPSPRFLLLDEPLSALDPHVRLSLRAELKDVQRRLGVTTLMVTHDREEALALSDLVVVLRAGRVEQAASPRELFDAPATAFVADFVAGMNLIEARSAGEDALTIGDCRVVGPRHGFAPGAPVCVAAAPDSIQLTAADAPGACPALVRSVEFAGRTLRVLLTIEATGEAVRVAAPVHARHHVGERVGLRFDAGSLRCFPAAT